MGVTDPGVTECGETWPAVSPTCHKQSMEISGANSDLTGKPCDLTDSTNKHGDFTKKDADWI